MKIPMIAKIARVCNELDIEDEVEVNNSVDLSLDIITAYLFQKKYDKSYNELNWYLEEGARDFVKEIESKWANNKIDELELCRDTDFIEFISDNYATISDEDLEEELDYFYDECLDELRDMELDEVKSLRPWIDVWVFSATSSKSRDIDIDDFIEDNFDEEDEDDD